jgi:uncharacterized cupredoxin-like copper-binding protein
MIGNIRVVATTATLAALAAAAACSSSGAAKPGPGAAGSNTISVTAYDKPAMHYAVSGRPQAGLVTITFKNAGDDAHEMSLAKLKPGVTLAKFKAALRKPNAEKAANALLLDPHGEVMGPQIVGPGLSETATVRLAAAHYIVVCFLPGEDGMPQALMGMVGELTVGSGTSTAVPPHTDGTVTLTDHKINLPGGFDGGGSFAVTNTGTKAHDFSLAKLNNAPLPAYFQCVAGSFGKGTPIDRCPGALAGGITSIPPGHTAYLKIAPLPAGSYGYVSTEGDGADFKAGLNGTFSVG